MIRVVTGKHRSDRADGIPVVGVVGEHRQLDRVFGDQRRILRANAERTLGRAAEDFGTRRQIRAPPKFLTGGIKASNGGCDTKT